jgi:hypothetical protein
MYDFRRSIPYHNGKNADKKIFCRSPSEAQQKARYSRNSIAKEKAKE